LLPPAGGKGEGGGVLVLQGLPYAIAISSALELLPPLLLLLLLPPLLPPSSLLWLAVVGVVVLMLLLLLLLLLLPSEVDGRGGSDDAIL